jgi:hypothetical protein
MPEPDLFSWSPPPPRPPPTGYPPGIPEHICDLFEKLAFDVHRVGLVRYSARAILHRIRWHHRIERGDIHFKVNNNYSARLARWFMEKHPYMDGFFELREPHNEDE